MNFIDKFRLNYVPTMKLTVKIIGVAFSFVAVFLLFVTWDEIGITEISSRVLIFLAFCLISFIGSSLLVVFVLKKKRIWTKGKNSVYALYGNIMDYAFKLSVKKNNIIVIPVNDTFETIVESPSEKVSNPLVSPNAIHGRWVTSFCTHMNMTVSELNSKIKENLELQKCKASKVYTSQEKTRGNLCSYDIGTIAVINGPNNSVFFLLVISKFDSENNARATKKQISEAVQDLLQFYDKKGQGDSLYIPLVGTGISRASLTHLQSLNIIKHHILNSDKKVNGNVNIVVFDKDRDKVSIFK